MVKRLAGATLLLCALVAAPARAAETAFIFDAGSQAIRVFALDGAGTPLSDPLPVSGLAANDAISDIAIRPADGKLYAVTVNTANNPDTLALYRLDVSDAAIAAVLVGTSDAAPPFGGGLGIAFNPVVDRIRVVFGNGRSLRLNPDTAALAASDADLAYDAGDPNAGATPRVDAVGYTNSVAGATSTTVYGIDSDGPRLVRLGGPNSTPSPNGGVLTTIAELGTGTGLAGDLDISAADGTGYWLKSGFFSSDVYALDPATGMPAIVSAPAGWGSSLALVPASVISIPAATITAKESDAAASVTVTRSGPTTGAVTVPYEVEYGNSGPDDVSGGAGTITLADGATTGTISVPLKQDTLVEGRETFTVRLGDPAGNGSAGAVAGVAATTVTIEDDDVSAVPTPSPTASPGPSPDTKAPTLAVSGVPKKLRRARLLRGFTVTVFPSEPISLDLGLRATPKTGAFAAAYELSLFAKRLGLAPGARKVKVKPARKLIGRIRRSARIRLVVEAVDAAGNRATATKTVTVTR